MTCDTDTDTYAARQVYTAAHERTCQGRPGSYLHEELDSKLFCDFRVDFLKTGI
jgi:hypothetical protein